MTVDYLLVGQGLAGTALAHTLLNNNLKICVLDANTLPSSSQAAAGIFNPVTGNRLVKTWQADVLFPFLMSFYQRLEVTLGAHFIHFMPVYRPFRSVEAQNEGISRTASPELSKFIQPSLTDRRFPGFIQTELGGLETRHSGYVAVPEFLKVSHDYFEDQGILIQSNLDTTDLHLSATGVTWKGVQARKIIFCEGTHAIHNPYFDWLPFRQVKGQLLTVEMEAPAPDCIVKQGVFLVPLTNNTAKVGATYEWNAADWETTLPARTELMQKLEQWLLPSFRVTGQQAGIRPATADRRPFIGLHPDYPVLGIFNGLGSKGVSLAPYYAQLFSEFLEDGKELDKEVNINRYFPLYFTHKR
jgi:glycine/D-amino acid oxidase-like deaminating enzyme